MKLNVRYSTIILYMLSKNFSLTKHKKDFVSMNSF